MTSYSVQCINGVYAIVERGFGRVPRTFLRGEGRDECWREARRLARGCGGEAVLWDENGSKIAYNDYSTEPKMWEEKLATLEYKLDLTNCDHKQNTKFCHPDCCPCAVLHYIRTYIKKLEANQA